MNYKIKPLAVECRSVPAGACLSWPLLSVILCESWQTDRQPLISWQYLIQHCLSAAVVIERFISGLSLSLLLCICVRMCVMQQSKGLCAAQRRKVQHTVSEQWTRIPTSFCSSFRTLQQHCTSDTHCVKILTECYKWAALWIKQKRERFPFVAHRKPNVSARQKNKTKRKPLFLRPPWRRTRLSLTRRLLLVMLTAGQKLTSSVDPERDPAVALGQMRPLEAVFVLEAAVRSFVGSRAVRRDASEKRESRQKKEYDAASACSRPPLYGHRHVFGITADVALPRPRAWRFRCRANRALADWSVDLGRRKRGGLRPPDPPHFSATVLTFLLRLRISFDFTKSLNESSCTGKEAERRRREEVEKKRGKKNECIRNRVYFVSILKILNLYFKLLYHSPHLSVTYQVTQSSFFFFFGI